MVLTRTKEFSEKKDLNLPDFEKKETPNFYNRFQ
jgi:hypothetical protein